MFRLAPLALALVSVPAFAQIVDVQSRFTKEPEPGIHGAVEASVDWRTGSNDFLAVRGGLTGQGLFDKHLVRALVQGEYGLSNGERTLSRTLEHLRYRYLWLERVHGEAFLQHEFNEFRRLTLRGLVGAGARFDLIREEKWVVATGLAMMLEHERLAQDAMADAGEVRTDLRLSSYLLARVALVEGLLLAQTLYFQPRADHFSDLRVLSETSVTAQANAHVGLTLGFTLVLDRAPPLGVSPLDTQLRSAIAISF